MASKPGLAATAPERLEFMLAAAAIVAQLVARGRVSVRELAGWWQCPASHAAEKIRGERPIHLGEVMALPDRFADDVLDEARMAVRARRLAQLAHG